MADKLLSVTLKFSNNTSTLLFPDTPTSHAELEGFLTESPESVLPNIPDQSVGQFKTHPDQLTGICAIVVYDSPDPNYVIVLYVSNPIIQKNIVKVVFMNRQGLVVDKRLVARIKDCWTCGSSAIHGYFYDGQWNTLFLSGTIPEGTDVTANFSLTSIDTSDIVAKHAAKAS